MPAKVEGSFDPGTNYCGTVQTALRYPQRYEQRALPLRGFGISETSMRYSPRCMAKICKLTSPRKIVTVASAMEACTYGRISTGSLDCPPFTSSEALRSRIGHTVCPAYQYCITLGSEIRDTYVLGRSSPGAWLTGP